MKPSTLGYPPLWKPITGPNFTALVLQGLALISLSAGHKVFVTPAWSHRAARAKSSYIFLRGEISMIICM